VVTRRYVTLRRPVRPRAEWSDDVPLLPVIHVTEPADRTPQPTGLYDANGVELYRVDEREPVGFLAGRVR
jgi:hypothetical protein